MIYPPTLGRGTSGAKAGPSFPAPNDLQHPHGGAHLVRQRLEHRPLALLDRRVPRSGNFRAKCERTGDTSQIVGDGTDDIPLQLCSFHGIQRHPHLRRTRLMSATTIRILLVDDHAILREGLAALLNGVDGMQVIGQAGDGATAIDLYRELLPDVVICDLRMVPMDGTEVTSTIRGEFPNARVILLTTYDTDEEVFRGLRAGASSYLLKDVEPAQLVDTVRAVYTGRKAIDPAIAAKLAEHVANDALTARQLEVLKSLAEGRSNIEIANTLYISEGTVKAHIKAILQKLGARDRTQAVTIGIKRGLIREL